MRKIKIAALVMLFTVFNFSIVSAVEVVYSKHGLQGCKDVGKYKKNMRNKSSKKKMEKKLQKMAAKDGATHVYVVKFIDNTNDGKGIKATAVGKKCD